MRGTRERLEAHADACRQASSSGRSRPDLVGGADLRNADLRGADLCGIYLGNADLAGADLAGADLRSAYLAGADLRSASLSYADLRQACLRDADLRNADLHGATGADDVPRAPMAGLAAAVLRQITEHPETWDQEVWHSHCDTAHCCGGWAMVLAGRAGLAAELRLGTHTAAKMLLGGTDHPFGAGDHDRVIPWLQARVAEEAGQ